MNDFCMVVIIQIQSQFLWLTACFFFSSLVIGNLGIGSTLKSEMDLLALSLSLSLSVLGCYEVKMSQKNLCIPIIFLTSCAVFFLFCINPHLAAHWKMRLSYDVCQYDITTRVEIFHLIWSKIWAVWAVFLDNYAQNLASKWAVWAVFERFIFNGFWTVQYCFEWFQFQPKVLRWNQNNRRQQGWKGNSMPDLPWTANGPHFSHGWVRKY